jgi:hypothetical protein
MNYNDGGMAAHAISVHDSPCISSLRERIWDAKSMEMKYKQGLSYNL